MSDELWLTLELNHAKTVSGYLVLHYITKANQHDSISLPYTLNYEDSVVTFTSFSLPPWCVLHAMYFEWYEVINVCDNNYGPIMQTVYQGSTNCIMLRDLGPSVTFGLYHDSIHEAEACIGVHWNEGCNQVNSSHHDIEQTIDAYHTLNKKGLEWNFTYFAHVNTEIGQIPMVAYISACKLIRYEKHPDQERMLLNLFCIASWLVGERATVFNFEESNHVVKGNWIAYMVTLITHCLLYRDDQTRSGVGIDRWTRLFASPSLQNMAFDCEDGTCAIIELLYILQTYRFSDDAKPLQAVQAYLQEYYTICLVIGQIPKKSNQDEDHVQHHVYAVLIDKQWLYAKERGYNCNSADAVPTILLESTAYIEACWRPLTKNKPQVSSKHPYMKQYARCMKTLDSAAVHNPVYGNVCALFPVDNENGERQLVVHSPTKIGGISFQQFMSLDEAIEMTTVIRQVNGYYRMLLDLHSLPSAVCPSISERKLFTRMEHIKKPIIQFTIPTIYANQHVIKQIKQNNEYDEQMNVWLTNELRLTFLIKTK